MQIHYLIYIAVHNIYCNWRRRISLFFLMHDIYSLTNFVKIQGYKQLIIFWTMKMKTFKCILVDNKIVDTWKVNNNIACYILYYCGISFCSKMVSYFFFINVNLLSLRLKFMVINATFNNISVISCFIEVKIQKSYLFFIQSFIYVFILLY
jgi:hypothetical protein